jgi:hypothetical protein
MSDHDRVIRNLTDAQPLDVEAELDRLMFTVGVVQAALLPSVRANAMTEQQTWDALWRRIPFIKALAELGREHHRELRAHWKRALQEPMPFGGEPLGLPEGEEP